MPDSNGNNNNNNDGDGEYRLGLGLRYMFIGLLCVIAAVIIIFCLFNAFSPSGEKTAHDISCDMATSKIASELNASPDRVHLRYVPMEFKRYEDGTQYYEFRGQAFTPDNMKHDVNATVVYYNGTATLNKCYIDGVLR